MNFVQVGFKFHGKTKEEATKNIHEAFNSIKLGEKIKCTFHNERHTL